MQPLLPLDTACDLVSLSRQQSTRPCVAGISFGCFANETAAFWVGGGCSGRFHCSGGGEVACGSREQPPSMRTSCSCSRDRLAISRLQHELNQKPVGVLDGRQWKKLDPPSRQALLRALLSRMPQFDRSSSGIPPLVRCVLDNSRSQFREDLLLLPLLLRLAEGEGGGRGRGSNGSFVELGAYDGITASNTLALERCFGWRGVLIEANPASFAKLRQAGRTATTVHAAICAGDGSGGTTLQVTAKPHVKSHVVAPGAAEVSAKTKRALQTASVPCRSLASIMREAGLGRATFLSLDVEGHEDVVLRAAGLPLSRFGLVMSETLEGREADAAKDARVEAMLTAAGLRPVPRLDGAVGQLVYKSAVYAHPAHATAAPHGCGGGGGGGGVALLEQQSAQRCTDGISFGCLPPPPHGNEAASMWVRFGCRGRFRCGPAAADVTCGYAGQAGDAYVVCRCSSTSRKKRSVDKTKTRSRALVLKGGSKHGAEERARS